jgi:undecaprenyl-diphosphatase
MNQNRYLDWQEQLKTRKLYRTAWTFFGIYSIVFIFLIGVVLIAHHQEKVVLVALIAFVIARLIFSPLIYLFYRKARPYQKFNFDTLFSRLLSTRSVRQNSFPSDHAVSFASIGFVFYWYMPSLGILLLILAAMNGYARIVLGFHDEWDVMAGWLLGILAALIAIVWLAPVVFTRL